MLQLRPTFSESWYRVAMLKPKLRAGAQISRQFYRGDRWYVVRDPAGNQFHRLSDPAYRFVGLLNGHRTISEAWDLVGGQLADDAPTQPEVIQILSQLYAANLLETDITPDATVLLRRHKQQSQQKLKGRLMNVLFPRLPIWDPDNFLVRWMPVARVLFSKLGALIWIIVIGAALATVLPEWTRLKSAANHALDVQHNWENLFYLYGMFIFIKLIHELGHAFSCRRFGGECHELGIMLLVLVPTPYVDASTAWAFPSRWHRVFVGAAGMIVELFFAALCAFVWSHTQDGNIINQLAYNAMFIASVSTLIFNANPLLRYDGYYILSDFLEIPNLRQKSTEYAMGLIKRHIFRLKLQQPLPPGGQRVWLFIYAILSSIYRVFVGVMIILLVTFKVPVLGVLMAIGGVITWAVVPVYKLVKYLLIEPELHRKRGRAIAFSAAVAVAVFLLVGRWQLPVHIEFSGVLEPDNPVDASTGQIISGKLITQVAGTVESIPVKDSERVNKGDAILILTDFHIDEEVKVADAQVNFYVERCRADETKDLIQLKKDGRDLAVWIYRKNVALDRQSKLIVRAPFDGVLVIPKLHELLGAYIPRGQEIGSVQVIDRLIVRGDIDQKDFELVRRFGGAKAAANFRPEIRLAGLLGKTVDGGEVTLSEAAKQDLANPILGNAGGGEFQVDARDPKGLKTTTGQFETRVILDNPTHLYVPGQRAYVRFTLDKTPLAWEWTRRFLQLLQTSDSGKWL